MQSKTIVVLSQMLAGIGVGDRQQQSDGAGNEQDGIEHDVFS
jgi:hypothetical protein